MTSRKGNTASPPPQPRLSRFILQGRGVRRMFLGPVKVIYADSEVTFLARCCENFASMRGITFPCHGVIQKGRHARKSDFTTISRGILNSQKLRRERDSELYEPVKKRTNYIVKDISWGTGRDLMGPVT